MILSCNSCGKKFIVSNQAITSAGRVVQCGLCGNKWKQFPIKDKIINPAINKKINTPEKTITTKISKSKKKKIKKVREISLYSPEYLEKKHGINLENNKVNKVFFKNKKVTFGFYNSLILSIFIIIVISRGLYFFEDFIVKNLPFTKFYLDYFFESIINIFEIFRNLISNY